MKSNTLAYAYAQALTAHSAFCNVDTQHTANINYLLGELFCADFDAATRCHTNNQIRCLNARRSHVEMFTDESFWQVLFK